MAHEFFASYFLVGLFFQFPCTSHYSLGLGYSLLQWFLFFLNLKNLHKLGKLEKLKGYSDIYIYIYMHQLRIILLLIVRPLFCAFHFLLVGTLASNLGRDLPNYLDSGSDICKTNNHRAHSQHTDLCQK